MPKASLERIEELVKVEVRGELIKDKALKDFEEMTEERNSVEIGGRRGNLSFREWCYIG